MRGRISIVVMGLLVIAGCGLLDKLKKGDDAGTDAAAATTATAEPSASASASVAAAPDPAPSASADTTVFSPPGSCVDPVKDAKQRQAGMGEATVDSIADLDGDGKKDKTVGFLGMGMNWPFEIYVMRGSCGHWVGEVNGKGVEVIGFKSKGLKSLTSTAFNPCTADCGCVNQEVSYFFNGKTYVAGKTKDVAFNDPCDAGKSASADAGKTTTDAGATAAAYKVGDKLNVEWKGKVYPAAVIQVAGKDQYKVHYDGYGATWDEVVGPARIKGRR